MRGRKVVTIIFVWIAVTSLSFGFLASGVELLEKIYLEASMTTKMSRAAFSEYLTKYPYSIKAFTRLPKEQKIQVYVQAAKIPNSKKPYYIRQFSRIENGDVLLIDAIKQNKNLDDVLKGNTKVFSRRRVTNLEMQLMKSNNAKKAFLFGRSVIKRDVFECSRSNLALMKRGRAPIGYDGKKINLHHLKQQKHGALIELTESEHLKHSSVLHRYVKRGSEITDRGSDFQTFKRQYWRARSLDCMVRR